MNQYIAAVLVIGILVAMAIPFFVQLMWAIGCCVWNRIKGQRIEFHRGSYRLERTNGTVWLTIHPNVNKTQEYEWVIPARDYLTFAADVQKIAQGVAEDVERMRA